MAKIFDTHAHYDDEAFDKDREELLSGLLDRGVGTVVDVSANFFEIVKVLDLVSRYDFMYAAVGVHPTEVYELKDSDIQAVQMFAQKGIGVIDPAVLSERGCSPDQSKVVAIGEIGLDYHYPDTDKEKQKKWFSLQIKLAQQLNLPIIVHSRDAAKDTLDIIREEDAAKTGLVMHCFSYEPEMAKIYTDMGVYLGIGGVVTFKNARKLKEVVKQMPMELMLLETDCPYLAPEPFRGKRNDSTLINYAAKAIAELRGMNYKEVVEITAENARRFYRL